uniref:Uncharacterized protein n=1 Tax=Salix viminalis TaxID=40686 RepID=A0A6N2KN43_SALVM
MRPFMERMLAFRGYLYKSLSATTEVIVESDKADVLERPVSPEMAIFYITQDTQRHPLLPEIKSEYLLCVPCWIPSVES